MCSLHQGGGSHALVGAAYNPGNSPAPNLYALNTYAPNDVSRQMIAAGAQPPFSGGRRRRRSKRGGGMLDYAPYIAGTVTSALGGYKGPDSPSPLSGQFARTVGRI